MLMDNGKRSTSTTLRNVKITSALALALLACACRAPGMKLASVFERLLEGWKQQGYELVSTQKIYEGLVLDQLPRHEVLLGEIPGRSGTMLLQGPEFLADATN